MLRPIVVSVVASLVSLSAFAADVHRVLLRVEPAQTLVAVVIRSGELTQSVSVRNGAIEVPVTLPLPWTLGLTRFEASLYTEADREKERPWIIREFGTLQGTLQWPPPRQGDRFVWVLQRSGAAQAVEREFVPGSDGAFRLPLAPGVYHGAVLGAGSATRVRSGTVIKPGQTTDLGVLLAERTVPVSVRVVDGRSGKPLHGAKIVWDPPGDVLNSSVLRGLYARRWSATTDRRGIAELPSVGPIPHSVRWRVDAGDYAPAQTARLQLKAAERVILPDVRLLQKPSVVVRVQFPRRGDDELDGCTLVAGELKDPHSPRFSPVARRPLVEGDTRFQFSSYGKKRVWVTDRAGKTIRYHDFDVKEESTLLDFILRRAEIHGRVTQRGKGVPDSLVTLADPHDSKVMLSQVRTSEDGEYRLMTWQAAEAVLYTISLRAAAGNRIGGADTRIDIAGRDSVEANLEIPGGGLSITVVDAIDGAPVKATVRALLRFDQGGASMSTEETDARGKLELSGFKNGSATLHIEAKGYRAADVELAIRPELPEATIRLEKGQAVSGRVVSPAGWPVAGARILGGFPDEYDPGHHYSATTDGEGRFTLSSAPPANTTFYVIAAGYALGITSLDPEQPVTVILQPPSSGSLALRQGNKSPEKVYLLMASPAGRNFIPLGVFDELAEVNGMTIYQLCGSSVDGDVILPQFLPPGTYDFFLALRGGNPFRYHRIGSVTAPLTRNQVMAIQPQ